MLFLVIGAILTIALVLVFFYCDGDLTLMFLERYGKPPESLAKKVVWITGASSGIGRALAIKLATLHCQIVISARRKELLNQVKEECLGLGAKDDDILVLPMDVTNIPEHKNLMKIVLLQFGRIDILVNNAGRSQRAVFEKVDIQVDRNLFELNVFSLVSLTTTVMAHFLEGHRGHVAVVSSLAGKMGAPGSRSYTGSKHALHGYFECLRIEKAGCIDVTMLCPGPVFSEILKSASTENQNETVGEDFKPGDKRMTAERCAELFVVALANKSDEVWVANQPFLMIFYASQYFPSITRWVLKKLGSNALMKMRDGREVSKKMHPNRN